jgi:hypothetical protein
MPAAKHNEWYVLYLQWLLANAFQYVFRSMCYTCRPVPTPECNNSSDTAWEPPAWSSRASSRIESDHNGVCDLLACSCWVTVLVLILLTPTSPATTSWLPLLVGLVQARPLKWIRKLLIVGDIGVYITSTSTVSQQLNARRSHTPLQPHSVNRHSPPKLLLYWHSISKHFKYFVSPIVLL